MSRIRFVVKNSSFLIKLFAILLLMVHFQAEASISSTSGTVMYVDSSSSQSPKLLANYVSYNITNDTGSTIPDAWVTIGSFTGAYVSLAPNETGVAHLGTMAAGSTRTVFFYLQVDCSSFSAGQCNVGTAQPFVVRLYSGPPTSNLVGSQSFSVTVQETIAAQSNTVSAVVTQSNNPDLGMLLTVTITGSTGTIGSAKVFYESPASYVDFPANIFRLYSTSVTFSGGNTGTYSNVLLVPSSAFTSTSSTNYSFVATFLVSGMKATSTAVSPVAYISSGNQIKHTDTSGYSSLPSIAPTDNTLTLSKLVDSQVWPTGGTPTYTLRISNAGAVNITVDDFVDTLPSSPAATSYVPGSSTFSGSAIGDPNISGNTLTWSRTFTVPANGSADLTFQATVPNVVGSYTNSAVTHIGTTQLDTTISTADNSPATVSLSVGSPDLTISKTHAGTFSQGQTGATYTLTASNSGNGPTAGTVTVTDTLPSGLTATTITGTGWSCTLGTLTCTRSDALAASGSYPAITLTVNVANNAAASLTNAATVSGGGEVNTANDSASDLTSITQVSDLTITKTHSGSFTQGQSGATYSITVSNSGAGATSGTVTVTDALPTGLTATALSGTGWSCTLGTLTCTRSNTLAASSSYPAITLTVTVANNAAASLTNTASVSGGGEINTANDSASDVTTITQVADLTITKTHSGSFTQGQTGAAYSITVSNTGLGATTGTVTVTDTLPTVLTATAMSGTGWSCTLGTVTCTRSDALSASSSYPAITLTVTVANNASSSLTNMVAVSGGGELNTANDSASDVTTITQVADLTITKTHSGNFTQGQTGATYSITVSNGGPGATSGTVTVIDTLPTGLTATAIGGTGWSCTLGTLTCTRNDNLASASSYPAITLTVTVASNAAASITNTASVSGGGEINTSNDSASDVTSVTQLADLTIAKSHVGNFTQRQIGAIYTITVSNNGSGASSGTVTMTDALPGGLSASALGGTGWNCTLATLSCMRSDAVAAASSYPAITLTVNVASNAPTSVTNVASVSGGGETNTGNDSASDVTNIDSVTPQPTSTSLAVSPGNTVNAGTPVTLTATVLQGSNPVFPGTVIFCDASASACTGSAILGTAQLGNTGTASLTLTLGSGTYSIKAVFTGTFGDKSSTSTPQSVTVNGTGGYVTTTAISASGSASSYTLVGTVSAFGKPVPTGSISFLDTTNSNAVIGSPSLDAASLAFASTLAQNPAMVDGTPAAATSGDFNNDGKPDLAVPQGTTSKVSIFLGNGDGTFQSQSAFDTDPSGQPYAVAVGDFNSDGNADLAVTNIASGGGTSTISVLLGNGDGTFQSQVAYIAGNRPSSIAIADFDGDGNADIVVANRDDNSIGLLLGNGDGTFQAQTTFATGNAPLYVAVADLNADGNLDLIVADNNDNTLSVLLGNGDGTFQAQATYTVGSSPLAAISADVNGDGIPDIVVTNSNDNTIGILLGIGDGTFQAPTSCAAGQFPAALISGDFDGDGKIDLATLNSSEGNVSILLGNGDGTFQSPIAASAGVSPSGLAIGDFNSDGLADAVTISNAGPSSVGVLLSQHTEIATLTGVSFSGTGTHDVLASFSGDANYNVSESTTIALNGVGLTSTTTQLVASPNPATLGQTVTLTATISPAPTGGPLGTVSFYDGATLIGTGSVNSSGVATLTISTLGTGSHSITAVYSGNSSFATSTSSPADEVVSLNATTTALTASPNPAGAGQTVTLMATISPTPTGSPLGTVSFYDGSTLIGTGNVNSSGVGTLTISTLGTGSHSLTAVYSGNSSFATSTSSPVNQVVNLNATTTALTASPNPSAAEQPVTLTATISPTPTGGSLGTVSFYDGATLIGTGTVNSSGVATLTTSTLAAGSHILTAVYSGDGSVAGSTSSPITEIVNPIPTITSLTASPNPSTLGQSVTLTARVQPIPTGLLLGAVNFFNGATLIGTGNINASGVATTSTSNLAAGTYTITAVYTGNSTYAASTSTAVSLTVNNAATYTVSAPPTPFTVNPGGSVAIKVSVPPLGGTYDHLVTMSATGLPTGATAAFNPSTVIPGGAGATTMLTIQTAPLRAGLNANGKYQFFLGFGVAFGMMLATGARKGARRTVVLMIALLTLTASTATLSGCGGGWAGLPASQSQTYVVTITGTSGSLHPSTTVTLIVK